MMMNFKILFILLFMGYLTSSAFAMITGPEVIIQCPDSSDVVKESTLISGNTRGGTQWSDGYSYYPMLPRSPAITRCGDKGKFFWISEANQLGEIDRWKTQEDNIIPTEWKEAEYVRWLTEEEYLEAIATGLGNTREKMLHLRMEAWWSANSASRLYPLLQKFIKRALSKRKSLQEIIKQPSLEQGEDELFPFIIRDYPEIIKAEFLRQLGRFEEVLTIPLPEKLTRISHWIHELAKQHHSDASLSSIPSPFSQPSPAKENLEQLIKLLKVEDKNELLMKVEALRQLGRFQEASQILLKTNFPKEMTRFTNWMHNLIAHQNRWVRKLFEKLDSKASAKKICISTTQLPFEQCQTLIALFNITKEFIWNINDSPCTWEGITCHAGQVTEIRLQQEGILQQELFPPLEALSHLETIHLERVGLTGNLPDFEKLSRLKTINLSRNLLKGSIPTLTTLTQLQELNLAGNQLTGPIPKLTTLTQLQNLNLAGNQLNGSLPNFTSLKNLQELNLFGNEFQGYFPDLTGLRNLRIVDISVNHLNGPIPELTTLTQLQELNLFFNQFNGFLPDFTGLKNLRELNISGNHFCGEISYHQFPITQLSSFLIMHNHLTTSDPQMIAFLNKNDSAWKSTQTPCPDNLENKSVRKK
jgi:Leucine-rich repeat (LRR) protein